jgi:hypothetical protein
MRWNGDRSLASAWADVVCIDCHATYEIEPKKGSVVIDNCFHFKSIPGGSFETFMKYKPIGKRFLLLVSRERSLDKTVKSSVMDKTVKCSVIRTYHHPTTLSVIDYVTPRLTDKSFQGNCTFIGTTIHVKKLNKTSDETFYKVPECKEDFTVIAELVYDSHFGTGSWEAWKGLPVSESQEGHASDTSVTMNPNQQTAWGL